MSRGVRDLRELICVSRLTIRDSDEEIPWDEDDEHDTPSDSLSSEPNSRQGSGHSRQGGSSREVVSPDSGICTNGQPDNNQLEASKSWKSPLPPHPPPSATRAGKMRRKKKKKTKVFDPLPQNYDLPKPSVLPPVQSRNADYDSSSSECSTQSGEVIKHGNFDEMLTYVDTTVISEWLEMSNAHVTDIAVWCHTGDNFVHFAHFWLSDFSDIQKQDIFKLEADILLDQLSFAFLPGRNAGKVKHRDLVTFLDAVFREYPGKLFSSKGAHLFLDVLSIISSERRTLYKKLLADVKVSTRVKQHAQWCLAVRSYALVSVWTSVVNFYRRLLPSTGNRTSAIPVPIRDIGKQNPNVVRVQQAIRNGFVDVLNYFLQSGKVAVDYTDDHQRTLVFTAVMHNQAEVLKFLILKTGDQQLVNKAADTGNTPLHAASNSGNEKLVKILLEIPDIDVNVSNPQCSDATPLHLATMHGHYDVVVQLLAAGADTQAKMDDMTPLSIATDFGHDDIAKAFDEAPTR